MINSLPPSHEHSPTSRLRTMQVMMTQKEQKKMREPVKLPQSVSQQSSPGVQKGGATIQSCMILFQSSPVTMRNRSVMPLVAVWKLACLGRGRKKKRILSYLQSLEINTNFHKNTQREREGYGILHHYKSILNLIKNREQKNDYGLLSHYKSIMILIQREREDYDILKITNQY